jgi:hypothetical protein
VGLGELAADEDLGEDVADAQVPLELLSGREVVG